jgi:hypothetical protein
MYPESDHSRMMDRIRKTTTLEDILPLIEALSKEIEEIMSQRKATESEIKLLLRPLGALRVLLGRLDLHLGGQDGNSPQALIIRDLARRCLDVEGMIKEARNDLVASRLSHAS